MVRITIKHSKTAHKMEQLTEEEKFLYNLTISLHRDKHDPPASFFSDDYNGDEENIPDILTDDIRVVTWILNGKYELIDINSWPGDNEYGCIFLKHNHNIVPLFLNNDARLTSMKDNPFAEIEEPLVHIREDLVQECTDHDSCIQARKIKEEGRIKYL